MIAAALLQSTVVSHWRLMAGSPDIVLLSVIAWNLLGRGADGLLWAFFGGLFADLLSAGPLGAHTLGMLIVGFLAGLTEGRLYRSHILLPLASALIGTLVFHSLYLGLLALTGYPVAWGDSLSLVTLPAVFLNLALMLPLYALVQRLYTWLRPASVEI